ncbi:hypothetical protein ACFX13_013540 [Malus domestica]
MGFSTTWINLVMTTVTTVSYSFLVNGTPKGYLMPTRGLRHGDPLSLYLFNLCAMGLSTLIARKEQTWRLQGISIENGDPFLNHLLFADDSFLFTQATEDDYKEVADTLQLYERGSGQMIGTHLGRPVDSPPLFLHGFHPKPASTSLHSVTNLIDSLSRACKIDTIATLFSSIEVNLIRFIPLSIHDAKDELTWHYEAKGTFSIKIAYHVAQIWLTPVAQRGSSSSNENSFSNLLSIIWKENIGPKESVSHILGDCHFAHCAWLSSPMGPLRRLNEHISFKLWAADLALSLAQHMFETFMLICSVFLQANAPQDKPEDKDDGRIFFATTCINFHDVTSPLHAKALATRESALWAVTKGFTNLLIDGDSLQIVGALSDPSLKFSVLGQVVEDTKALLPSVT